jgi:hypothetical protein
MAVVSVEIRRSIDQYAESALSTGRLLDVATRAKELALHMLPESAGWGIRASLL